MYSAKRSSANDRTWSKPSSAFRSERAAQGRQRQARTKLAAHPESPSRFGGCTQRSGRARTTGLGASLRAPSDLNVQRREGNAKREQNGLPILNRLRGLEDVLSEAVERERPDLEQAFERLQI